MVYLYDACDQISDFCHQQKNATKNILDGRKDGKTDGQTNRGKTVYPPPPSGSGGIIRNSKRKKPKPSMPILSYYFTKPNTKKLTIKSMVLLFI